MVVRNVRVLNAGVYVDFCFGSGRLRCRGQRSVRSITVVCTQRTRICHGHSTNGICRKLYACVSPTPFSPYGFTQRTTTSIFTGLTIFAPQTAVIHRLGHLGLQPIAGIVGQIFHVHGKRSDMEKWGFVSTCSASVLAAFDENISPTSG